VWVRRASNTPRLESLILPAGIDAEVPLLQETIRLAPGDRLLVYSDGLTEARNTLGEEFGEERLVNVLGECGDFAAEPLCGRLVEAVTDFSGGAHQADDLTVLALKSVSRG
jgi:sigma-B regulation protein RsbU (phosphoserine phosphatase)